MAFCETSFHCIKSKCWRIFISACLLFAPARSTSPPVIMIFRCSASVRGRSFFFLFSGNLIRVYCFQNTFLVRYRAEPFAGWTHFSADEGYHKKENIILSGSRIRAIRFFPALSVFGFLFPTAFQLVFRFSSFSRLFVDSLLCCIFIVLLPFQEPNNIWTLIPAAMWPPTMAHDRCRSRFVWVDGYRGVDWKTNLC